MKRQRYYKPREAAERVQRHISTIYRWMESGELPHFGGLISERALLATDKAMRLRTGRPRKEAQ